MQRNIAENYSRIANSIPSLPISDSEYAAIASYAYSFKKRDSFSPETICTGMMILSKYVYLSGDVAIDEALVEGCMLLAEFTVSHSLLDIDVGTEVPPPSLFTQRVVERLEGNLYTPSVVAFYRLIDEGSQLRPQLRRRETDLMLAYLNPKSRIYTPAQLAQLCSDNSPTFRQLVVLIKGADTFPDVLVKNSPVKGIPVHVVTRKMLQSYAVIGRGAYSAIYKTPEGKALKADSSSYSYFKELAVMKLMDHPNIQSIEEYSLTDYKTITMKMQKASLDKIIGSVSPDLHLVYILSVARAVEALHSYGILHGDIKPDNVLVTRKGTLKLADFGSCRTYCSYKPSESFSEIYVPGYRPPELLTTDMYAMYSLKADVWAVGILAAHIINGRNFADEFDEEMSHEDMKEEHCGRLDRVPKSTFALRQLVGQLLDPNPDTRITMAQGCLLLE